MKATRWDIEGLRALLVLAALIGLITLITGVTGIGYSSEEGVELTEANDLVDRPSLVTSLEADELDITSVEGFVPIAVEGEIAVEGTARILQIMAAGLKVIGVLTAAVAFFLVLTDAARDDPFIRRNVRRWHVVAGGLTLGVVGMMVESFAVLEAKSAAGLELSTELNFGWVAVVLVAGAMARIWEIGVGLREEQSLTV